MAQLAIILFVLLFMAVPIGISLAGSTAVMVLFDDFLTIGTLFEAFFNFINRPTLIAIPFFIYAGFLMEKTGLVRGLFDFAAFSEISLGRYWKDRTDAERKEFTDLCRRLIERNYADPKLYKKAEAVEYDGATVSGDKGEVKTLVSYKTEKSTIDYQLKKVGDDWLIYDMVIDDLSIAKNNRSQFRKEIRKTSYEGLVQKLKDKLAKQDQ